MAHVVYPYGGEPTPFVDYGKFTEYEEKRVRAEVIALEKELRGKGLNVTHRITIGFSAADDIIEVGKKVGADLVVMSTHGRSGLGRWVLGSVAEKVLRYGEIPLLLVNARAG
jgi:nucleotide-binding universal stress UspA family protein